MGHSFRFFSGDEVKQALRMEVAIDLMRDAFVQLSSGEAKVPVRMSMDIPEYHATGLLMPVYLPHQKQVGLKAVSIHADNPEQGLPYIHALMMVTDATNGRPLGVMHGGHITSIRTGAASGLATELLARTEARVAAIFGAGVQARTQLEAVCAVRDIERAYVFNRGQEEAERYASEMQSRLGISVSVATRPDQLQEADVICTATTALDPVFDDQYLKPGAHINGIGSYRPDMAEIPPETLLRARIIVDHVESCLEEAGDIIKPLQQGLFDESHLAAELGEIVAGHKVGRTSEDEITVFKSVGNAVQDLAVAGHVIAVAEELGLGTEVTL